MIICRSFLMAPGATTSEGHVGFQKGNICRKNPDGANIRNIACF